MSNLDIEGFEKMIFGRNKNLNKIQKLYAEASYFTANVYLVKLRSDGLGINVAKIESIFEELYAEIDKQTPNPRSSNYNRFIAMKALVLLLHSSFQNEESEKVRKAIELLEPIKTAPEATEAYIDALLHMDCGLSDANVEYLVKAEAAYDHILRNKVPTFYTWEVFGGIRPQDTKGHRIKEAHDTILLNIFRKFASLKDDAMKLKYVLPSLKAFFNLNILVNKVGIESAKIVDAIPLFLSHILCLIETHHFPQVNRLLSIFAFHVTKARRDMPNVMELETQAKLDEAKALVSFWYSLWAEKLLKNAIVKTLIPDLALVKPIHTEMHRFDELMEPGVEIYQNQFPVNFISTDKEWKKTVKKGKLWCQRALEYFEKYKFFSDKCNVLLEETKCLLKRFDTLAKPEFP